jgi:protein TonB
MRIAVAIALLLHAAAVLLLVQFGTPRRLADADGETAGIPVIFSLGGGGEAAGLDDALPPPAAQAAAEQTPEAEGEAQSNAVTEASPPEEVTAEAPPEDVPPRTAEAPAPPETASTLPRPPPPPPDPPPPRRDQARADPPSPPSAQGPAPSPVVRGEADETAPFREGSAAFLLATREATVGRRVDPVVPVEARRARMQGTVVLAVTISPEGVPSAVDVVRSSGHFLLDRAAQEALWQWRFDPARRGGVPVEERIAIPISFRIVD